MIAAFSYIVIFLILGLCAIGLSLLFIFMLDSLIKGHELPTSRRATRELIAIMQKHKPNAQNFYDAGCAHGTLLLRLKKSLPTLHMYGIDDSMVRIFYAKLKAKILKRKIDFKKQNIFQIDMHNADIVYTYLWYDLMPVLEKKLKRELKQGAVIITNTSHFQDWQPVERVVMCQKKSQIPDFETLFVYIKK
jgi:SAM-dependent methyltransferase